MRTLNVSRALVLYAFTMFALGCLFTGCARPCPASRVSPALCAAGLAVVGIHRSGNGVVTGYDCR